MFRVRQSFETSKLIDEVFINLREFFTPTPEFALASIPVNSSGDDLPMTEHTLRRRRRRRLRGRQVPSVSPLTKLY